AGRVRKKSGGVETFRVLQDPFKRKKTVRYFESGDAAKRGRAQNRSTRLRADRERNHSCSDRRRRTAETAARRVLQVSRIPRWRRISVGESRGMGFPQQDRAAISQAGDDRGVCRSNAPFINGRTVFGGKSSGFEDVFRAKGNSG